ncbi:glycogenin glucosyltransferase [Ascosphaera aggregata]|nr:glycogenin glucosyltransferase [Ascosphaera aggregata]
MASQGDAAYCTILLTDNYLPGAMVLAHSLRDNGSTARLAALVTADTLSSQSINELRTVYDDIIPIRRIVNHNPANLFLMGRPDLIAMFSKIELWRQLQYQQLVYIDADAISLRAPDELLDMETHFAAVPDVGWPDCFNSGMMVLRPNLEDYNDLTALAETGTSFDGADQGLLNMHFKKWDRLSFTLNCTPSAHYQYVPAFRHFQQDISIIHFIGSKKPWQLSRDGGIQGTPYQELLGHWWAVYDRHYRPQPRKEAIKQQVSRTIPRESTVSDEAARHTTGKVAIEDHGFEPAAVAAAPETPPLPPYEQHQEDRQVEMGDQHVENQISSRPTSGHYEEPDLGHAPQHVHQEQTVEDSPSDERSHAVSTIEEYSDNIWHEESPANEHDPTDEAPYEELGAEQENPPPTFYEEPAPLSIVPQYVYGEQHMHVPQARRRRPALMNTQQSQQEPTNVATSRRARLATDEKAQEQPESTTKKRAFSPHPKAPRAHDVHSAPDGVELKSHGESADIFPSWHPTKPLFKPPMVEWNPAREPPPKFSLPEAPNLAFANYTMSLDTQLYQAPSQYVLPKPPTKTTSQTGNESENKDDDNEGTGLAKESPAIPTGAPKTVFPWEQYDKRRQTSRVFSPVTSATLTPSGSVTPATPTTKRDGGKPSSMPYEKQFSAGDIWRSFSRQSAWDDVPEIQEYVQALQRSRTGSVDSGTLQGIFATPNSSRRVSSHGIGAGGRAQLPEAAGVPRQTEWVGFTSDIFLRILRAASLLNEYITESKGEA